MDCNPKWSNYLQILHERREGFEKIRYTRIKGFVYGHTKARGGGDIEKTSLRVFIMSAIRGRIVKSTI